MLDPPYTFQWDSVPPGSYSLTARAFDNDGAFNASAPVAVVVLSNFAPTITITNPEGATGTITGTLKENKLTGEWKLGDGGGTYEASKAAAKKASK